MHDKFRIWNSTYRPEQYFCAFLDANKAFDWVHSCKMRIRCLLTASCQLLLLQVFIVNIKVYFWITRQFIKRCNLCWVMNAYPQNFVRVSWHGILSDYFLALNGAVLSLWCCGLAYRQRVWYDCYIGNHFVGVMAYADDIDLIAPTSAALRSLLGIYD